MLFILHRVVFTFFFFFVYKLQGKIYEWEVFPRSQKHIFSLNFKIQDLLNISQVYKVNNMMCNYYNTYYIHALIKQRNITNGSTQSFIFDPSSKHQTLDVLFTRRHMHTSDTDTQVHMHNRTATYMKNQNQNSSKHINLLCRWKHYNIYKNVHVTTLNEGYNRPPYIFAASVENKNKKSMFFLFYTEEESFPKSLRVNLLQQDA